MNIILQISILLHVFLLKIIRNNHVFIICFMVVETFCTYKNENNLFSENKKLLRQIDNKSLNFYFKNRVYSKYFECKHFLICLKKDISRSQMRREGNIEICDANEFYNTNFFNHLRKC